MIAEVAMFRKKNSHDPHQTCEAASHAIGWCSINMCGGGWGADSTAAAKEL